VPVTVTIPGSELVLARNRGATQMSIEFSGQVKDEFDTPIINLQDKLDIRLSDDTVAQLASRPIQYDVAFTLLPGRYTAKLTARDAEGGRTGTFETPFVIPNLNKEDDRIPISTVVLGNRLVPSSADPSKNPTANPLVYNGQKLIPSVTRVFSKTENLYVFLQAYERDATTTRPLVAVVTLYRGHVKALETSPLRVTDELDPRSKAVSLRVAVPLGGLDPGAYDCQVIVLDPQGQKVNAWRAPVVVVP